MPEVHSTAGRAVLEARGVRRSYRDLVAVAGVDLCLARGEIHALVGLNGAGKTTLMRLMLGMARPESGLVRLNGRDLPRCKAGDWARVGHLIETPFAYPELTVTENVVASARLRAATPDGGHGCRGKHFRPRPHPLGKSARPWAISWQLPATGSRVRPGPSAGRGGARRADQRLGPQGVIIVRESLRKAAERGTAVLVSSHHLDEVSRVAHRITVMHGGVLVGSLDPGGVDVERRFFDMVYAAERPFAGPIPEPPGEQ